MTLYHISRYFNIYRFYSPRPNRKGTCHMMKSTGIVPQDRATTREKTSSRYSYNENKYLLVVAIELGPNHCCYAFSLTNVNEIYVNKTWYCGQNQSDKTPTAILFGQDGFLDFGFEALMR